MRIGIDGRYIQDHFPGIGRYVLNLAQAMVPLLSQDERLILLRDPTQPSRWDLAALAGERVQGVDAPISPFSLRQQWAIPRILHRLGADLYHSPYYLMPYRLKVPAVVTMYDLIPLLFPQHVSPAARLLFRWMTALALRTASHVIVISQATRRDLLTFYHLPPQKVTAIPLATDRAFRPQPLAEVERVRRKYALPQGYLLYLGINKPHKNLLRLIDAFSRITHHVSRFTFDVSRAALSLSKGFTLIIAGAWDSRYPEPRQQVEALGLENAVRFLGPVPEADLPALYSAAGLFVFPSLYEGFGLPVLEAMACGVPVICSNTSSLPEIVGQAAIMVDPLDVDELAAAMERVLGNQELREEMVAKGMMQASRFSWERTARETLKIYKEAANSPTRAVFLDRDGTINEEVNHLRSSEQFRLLSGASKAIRMLNQKGWLVIVITNQSGLAYGYLTEEELALVHHKMKAALDREEARIDGIYVCPHQPDDGCTCRKPGTALFKQAAQEFDLDLRMSYAVGDKMTDLLPGARLGCRTVLILTGHGQEQLENKGEWEAEPDYIASDLLSAAQWILAETET